MNTLREKLSTLFNTINKKSVRLINVLISILLLFIIPSLSHQIDSSVKNVIHNINGQSTPDSNIVIISISRHDIEQLGGWPLRRNFYALLIHELSQYHVNKIGLEVFLSGANSMQEIYNDLLLDEIKKSGKVVLSSIIISKENRTDSLLLPQPVILSPDIKTGHINYSSDRGIQIPVSIKAINKSENCFAAVIAEKNINSDQIDVNVFSSWNKFRTYSSLEFMKLAEEKSPLLDCLKDKYILIGVTDPSLAKSASTYFDSELPGIGLHAFALDNILNNRMLKQKYSFPLTIVFVLLLLFLFYPISKLKYFYRYLIQLVGFLLLSFFLYKFFYIEIFHSYWLVPLVLLFLSELYFIYSERQAQLRNSFDENLYLKDLLTSKETKLAELERQSINSKDDYKDELLRKISSLKEEINKIKKGDDGEGLGEVNQREVKNFQGIVYRSDKIQKIVSLIEKIAPHDATVLIQGESGSGKELIAHAIHNLSNRKTKNFVPLNCAAIPETLLESELFGHVKGAFTNAIGDKKGKFELADGGTLFLDEVGETSEAFQTKLLRAIQFGEFYKVGSTQTQKVDVRIVAATNKNIEKAVKENKFREDLFYRLNVLKIELPTLRDRREDIEVLADFFCKRSDPNMGLSRIVLDSLAKNDWPGNVRELESVITHSLIMAKAENRNLVKLKDIPEDYRKYEKSDLEIMILESMRAKGFSHSAMNETAKELGGLSRTMVSETIRGIFFKEFVENNFDVDKTAGEITRSDSEAIIQKAIDKLYTYLENLDSGLAKFKGKDFNFVKSELGSKYKNLPAKYHGYLDTIIQSKMKSMNH